MTTVEKKVDALCRIILGASDDDRNSARADLYKLMGQPCSNDAETIIHELMAEIGVPSALLGHEYLVYAILLSIKDRRGIDNITTFLYPQVALKFDTTPIRVERAIRHAIEVAWERGDLDVLDRYFGNTVSSEKGKPTNSEFVARLANLVRLRLKQ